MDDDAYVDELLAVLTRSVSRRAVRRDRRAGADDGIDRAGGFGTEVQVTGLGIEPGEHGDELRVGFTLAVPDEPRLRHVPRVGSVDVSFDAEWRHLSGFDTAAAYAPEVARAVEGAARLLVDRHTEHLGSDGDPALELPDRATQWRWLLDALATEGEVRQVGPGRVEVGVSQPDGGGPAYAPVITAVVTPAQWEHVLTHDVSAGDSALHLGELLGPRDPDEAFVVCFKGHLEMSTREALPPVRGRAFERWITEARARAGSDGAQLGWFA